MREDAFPVVPRSAALLVAALLSVAPSIAGAQNIEKVRVSAEKKNRSSDLALTCRTAPLFDLGIYAGGAWSCNWFAPEVGMDGGYFHSSAGEGSNYFLMPFQQIRVDIPLTPNFRFEVPFSFDYSKVEDQDGATSVGIGAIVDYLLRRPDSAGIHGSWIPFLGAGYALNYTKFGDESTTENSILARLGMERSVNDFKLRFAGVYERNLEHDGIKASNGFGVTIGVSVPVVRQDWGAQMITEALRNESSGYMKVGNLYFVGAFNVTRKTASDVSTTSITVPDPQVGLFVLPGSQDMFALGLKTGLSFFSSEGSSARDLIFTPRVEINPFGHPLSSSTPIQIGVQGIIDNIHFDTGQADVSGTQFGVGGDISYVFQMAPSDIKIGIGFDHMFKNEDLGRPASNSVRVTTALDRYVLQKLAQKNIIH